MCDETNDILQNELQQVRYREQHRKYLENLLSHYQQTGELTTSMLAQATLAWHPFDWMETFAHEWYRAGEKHHYKRPDNFKEDLAAYESTVPKGESPSAEGLIRFFWERWSNSPWKPMWEDVQVLESLCDAFEKKVWRSWLQKYYQKAEMRGHRCQLDGLDMLVWGCAGRVMVTLRSGNDPNVFITFIATEKDSHYNGRPSKMGTQGVFGTLTQVMKLVTSLLARSAEAQQLIQPNKDVTHPAVVTHEGE